MHRKLAASLLQRLLAYLLSTVVAGDHTEGRNATPGKKIDILAAKRMGGPAPLEHVVTVWSETDIFCAVGLSYVPPHMRHFHSISS